jgi:hypothetical protein
MLTNSGCAGTQVIPTYEPPRCGYFWHPEAIQELNDLYQIATESTTGMIRNIETGEIVVIEVDLIDKNLGKYHRHCLALDAYLDANKPEPSVWEKFKGIFTKNNDDESK